MRKLCSNKFEKFYWQINIYVLKINIIRRAHLFINNFTCKNFIAIERCIVVNLFLYRKIKVTGKLIIPYMYPKSPEN